ncbi:MAG: asparagine synthase (glutamine-hydrolyzing) [Endomicrobiales bacterium]|nr:asparagine synthase (glutamine-hydrolyzing) [Endomicrobiales bacterium]
MCGIAGIYSYKGRYGESRAVIEKMTEALRSRGPDDKGFYEGDRIALGFRRLSIIDLVTGNQPMHNEEKNIWVVFNGEIYNFIELRDELQRKGHEFLTKADTEVIVHCYEEYGEGFVEHLDGMFSIGIYDEKNDRLVLARDRFGKKPLHYAFLDGQLVFASEIKSMLKHPGISREMNTTSLMKYLHFEYVPAPNTIFKGIKKLMPSEMLVCENGRLRSRLYWDIPYGAEKMKVGFDEAASEIRRLLAKAVKKRMISDVPIGVFLSGGIDSSSVAALMAMESGSKVKTFNIAFTNRDYDESGPAEDVALHIGSEHNEQSFSPSTLLDVLPEITDYMDEPFADPSVLPTYLLSKMTREKVTVALGGDGGDEIFGGYPTYNAHRLYDYYSAMPGLIKTAVKGVIESLPVSSGYFGIDFKLKRFISGDGLPDGERHITWMSALKKNEIKELLKASQKDVEVDVIYGELAKYAGQSITAKADLPMYIDAKMYLQDDILVKVDRASMAVSLEVRAPFLDKELTEYAARVPIDYKTSLFGTKNILKKAVEDLLPKRIINRSKHGFSVPINVWFRNELKPLISEYLGKERLKKEGIFDADYVSRLVEEHMSRKKEHRKNLWVLLMFQIWKEKYG